MAMLSSWSEPPLQPLETSSLPRQLTSFLGREQECIDLVRLLAANRLVTLTGPGGSGKTRLALVVADSLLDQFSDGVCFVALAPLSDPDLVASTIAQSLGLRNLAGQPVLESLNAYLRRRRLLLVLDNFEHLLAAAPLVSELLRASPALRILVTSRAPLELRGEQELAVPPLALPDPQHLPPLETLAGYGAVALFVERAAAIKPSFALTHENASVVAAICQRLDGLPLAIELAAGRIRLLSPAALLTRLARRLPLLTGGARDLPARQQTLRDTIAWSFDLLTEAERTLFRRLAVFVGGFTLTAAQAVADPEASLGSDVLDGVAALVAQSLLVQRDGPASEPRFGMLETIREYGLEQLKASGEGETTRTRHAAFFLQLAEAAEPQLYGTEQVVWLERLEAEQDNLRAVLGWSRDGEVAAELGLRLAGALQWYWRVRGLLGEGRSWVEAMLSLPGAAASTAARASALNAAARLANLQPDYAAGRRYALECVTIARELGDSAGVARALDRLAFAEKGEQNNSLARSHWQESVALFRTLEDRHGLALALLHLGGAVQQEGDLAASAALRGESAVIARAIGERSILAQALISMAMLARLQQQQQSSTALLTEALAVTAELGYPFQVLPVLLGLAAAAARACEHIRAARLFGAVEALQEATGMHEIGARTALFDRDVAEARAAVEDGRFAAAWAEGRAMTMAQAVAYALASSERALQQPAERATLPGAAEPTSPRPRLLQTVRSGYPDSLSAREVEVLRLLAAGRSNPEIASALVISRNTVERHVNHIFAKTGMSNRVEAATYAQRQGLLDR